MGATHLPMTARRGTRQDTEMPSLTAHYTEGKLHHHICELGEWEKRSFPGAIRSWVRQDIAQKQTDKMWCCEPNKPFSLFHLSATQMSRDLALSHRA